MSTAAMIERLIEAAVDYERASGIYAAGARRELSEARAAIEAALSPPEPTEGLVEALKPFAAEAEKLAEYFQDQAPDGERKVFRGSTLTFQNFRDATTALRSMPLQEDAK